MTNGKIKQLKKLKADIEAIARVITLAGEGEWLVDDKVFSQLAQMLGDARSALAEALATSEVPSDE